MEIKPGFVGIRKAYISTVNANGTYNFYFADGNSNDITKNATVMNVGSFGSGIFTTYHEGAPVWVGQSYFFEPIILGFADMPGSIEQGDILDSNDLDAPKREPGEIIIQASSGAHIDVLNTGDIQVSTLKNDGIYFSDANRSISMNSYQYYNLNDSGYTIEGRVRRLHPQYILGADPVFVDLLADPEADAFAVDVARDPTQKELPMNRARGTANVIRNPSFAEKREMILEFADSFFVRDIQTEMNLVAEFPKTIDEMSRSVARRRGYGTDEQTFDNLRHSTRTNLLKLDSNVIIERVQGTLVDIFGNVLDINYNKLPMPKLTEANRSDAIKDAHKFLKRSVAYHFQVNSRNISDTSTGSGKFTLDVDKEGQFKLNVPRSSSDGTIPTISTFTDETDIRSRIDVSGKQLSKSDITSPTGGKTGTAFHDMTKVADRLIRYTPQSINTIRVHGSTLNVQPQGDTPNIEFLMDATTEKSAIPDYTTTISVKNGNSAIAREILPALVGGRSGQVNFEGSLEMSIGKDDIDGKSLMLDTAGSLIGWLGADRNGQSAVVNADGAVLLNIGDYVKGVDGKVEFKQGTLTIRVNMVDEKDKNVGQLKQGQVANNKLTSDHIIHIGPSGIVISSGNGTPIVMRSSGNMMFESAGTMDFKAKEIRMDGGYLRKVAPKKGDI